MIREKFNDSFTYFVKPIWLVENDISPNVLRLGEGGDFTTNVHTKHTLQIYEKLSYEVLNRHFCQTAVISWPSVCRGCKVLV